MAYRPLLCPLLICSCLSTSPAVWAEEEAATKRDKFEVKDLLPVTIPGPLARMGLRPAPMGESKFSASRDTLRDPKTIQVYEKVAPAVVFITDGRTGFGTGVFIHPDGWLLTNHHVAEFMPYGSKSGALSARVVCGQLGKDGAMDPIAGYTTASVYRLGYCEPDLALLKLDKLPNGMKSVPYIKLADKTPPPGSNCIAIGNPGSGVMWTLRNGTVAGRGRFPRDFLDPQRLFHGGDEDVIKRANALIADEPSTQVLLSTCGVNPGDSGGPLVDEDGRLIALTFAGPVNRGAVVFDKFTYHVHLDEIKSFLKDSPRSQLVEPPAPLPAANAQALADMDSDKRPDTWVFVEKRQDDENLITGVLVDLDQDSPLTENQGEESYQERMNTRGALKNWDFEFAATFYPRMACFFDRDNDGQTDLVVIDQRSGPVRIVRDGQTWKAEEYAGPAILEKAFKDAELNAKYADVFLAPVRKAKQDFEASLEAAVAQ